MSVLRTVVKGCGGYLPERIMTNADISQLVETNDEWISSRTGIRERRIAGEGEYTSTMGLAAAKEALANAGMQASDIDLIVLATSTPDQTFPATAATIQAELGMTGGAAFDLQAVCSGFVYALSTADNFLRAGPYKRALVIGSEVFSRILDWKDRNTCVLFGDGAGAVVVEAELQPGTSTDRGILAACLRSDGRYRDKLYVDGGPCTTGTAGYLRMDGPEVFRHAVIKIAEAIDEALEMAGLEPSDIDWFVPHQANLRINEQVVQYAEIPPEKALNSIMWYGNTTAATVPLTIDHWRKEGKVKKGDLILSTVFGSGFTWGATVFRL